jgi:uncharacterized membrane protein
LPSTFVRSWVGEGAAIVAGKSRRRRTLAAQRQPLSIEVNGLEPKPPSRWLALDVFRSLAVLWMIQGHTFTALLRAELYAGDWAQLYSLLHGLTAPAFLLGAGLSYAIVRFGSGPQVGSRILRRALMLLALGVLLQLPAAPLRSILTRHDLRTLVVAPGALQLVAACLVSAEVLHRVTQGRARFACAASLVGIAIGVAAPFVWQQRWSTSLVLGGWLDGESGSLFPFVPWAVFFLLGSALGAGFGRRLWQQALLMPRLGALGLVASGCCYAVFLSGERLNGFYGSHPFWQSSPMFVVFRAGLVCAGLGLLSAYGRMLSRWFERHPRVATLNAALARHSLIAYVAHLVLLYGSPLHSGIARGKPSFDLSETALALAFVLTATLAFVLLWQRWSSARVSQVHRIAERKRLNVAAPEQAVESVATVSDCGHRSSRIELEL